MAIQKPTIDMRRWQGLDVEAEGTGISEPLSEQINLLGTMLGQVIREQAGEAMLALVPDEGGNQIVSGTGRFRNATGRVRLNGDVDMSLFFSDNIITFDCIFRIDFD